VIADVSQIKVLCIMVHSIRTSSQLRSTKMATKLLEGTTDEKKNRITECDIGIDGPACRVQ